LAPELPLAGLCALLEGLVDGPVALAELLPELVDGRLFLSD
jgi:hypothetical protein